MPLSTTDLRRRGDRFKKYNKLLRRRVAELEREVREARSAAFAAGSACAFQDCYRAVGTDLTDMLAVARGRKPLLNPVIAEMIRKRTDDLLVRAGIRRVR